MELTREEVLHIARLARLGINDEETNRMQQELSELLGHFAELQKVPTEGVPPTAHTLVQVNVMGFDETKPSLPQGEALINAPCLDGEFFRINPVLE